MTPATEGASAAQNRQVFEDQYSAVPAEQVARGVVALEKALERDPEYGKVAGFYSDGFLDRVEGRSVLELGAGRGIDGLVMARAGARRVTFVDIAPAIADLIPAAADRLGVSVPVDVAIGELPDLDLDLDRYDIIVGLSFLHHLTYEQEDRYIARIAALLEHDGFARFLEPATNSRMLDELRWLLPVPGRPSRLQRTKFAAWRSADPHPDRFNSSRHFAEVGGRYFDNVEITTLGGFMRLTRVLPSRFDARAFGRRALAVEQRLPQRVRRAIARSQVIELTRPRTH